MHFSPLCVCGVFRLLNDLLGFLSEKDVSVDPEGEGRLVRLLLAHLRQSNQLQDLVVKW